MDSPQVSPECVRFGIFEADLRSGELRRKGVKVRIQNLPFRALNVLLKRPGEIVSREDFRQALWPGDVFVDFDQGISSAIRRLRDALGDSAENPRFVETVGRRGYRWIAPSHAVLAEETVPYRVPTQELAGTAEDFNGFVSQAAGTMPSGEPQRDFTARYFIGLSTGAQKGKSRLRLRLLAFIVVATAVGLTGFYFWRSAHLPLISSVAVLPFDNLGAPADEAFSDGLTDEVAASISHLDGVRVTGRRSAYVFKEKHSDLRDVGARLNVEAVVEGSVQRMGDRTHVNVELNRTRDGFTIWSQTYDGTSADWMQIESEIAAAIARIVARDFSAGKAAPATRDVEAHALYWQARYFWNQRNFPDELKSVDLMQQAIARDPNYALAWAGLADSLAVIGDNENTVSPAAYMPRARDAALKALEIDPSLAEAHAVLAMVACHYDYDWAAAEREYKKSFELNPNYASAHQYYALGLMAHGRFTEARQQLETAHRLDPLALIVDVDTALLLKFQRNYDGVIAESQQILQKDPNYFLGYSMLAAGYYCEHRWDDWRAADAKVPQDDFIRDLVNGNTEQARVVLAKDIAQVAAGQLKAYRIMWAELSLGNRAAALDWLEKSYQNRDYWLLFINVDPEMDPIRSEPRFQAIVHRIGVA